MWGGLYALAAHGLNLIYGVMKMLPPGALPRTEFKARRLKDLRAKPA